MLPTVETWTQYVERIAGGMTQIQIADKIGVAQSNVGRWLRGSPVLPKAESVVAFARGFNQPPVEALVAAGYLSPDEAKSLVRTPLTEYSTEDLLKELGRRTV